MGLFERSIGKKEMKMEFKTQVCTTRSQSERLLELGLKKETADCRWMGLVKDSRGNDIPEKRQTWIPLIDGTRSGMSAGLMTYKFSPAWSLHRLIAILGNNFKAIVVFGNPYEWVIDAIEEVIKDGSILKEYLEEKE